MKRAYSYFIFVNLVLKINIRLKLVSFTKLILVKAENTLSVHHSLFCCCLFGNASTGYVKIRKSIDLT